LGLVPKEFLLEEQRVACVGASQENGDLKVVCDMLALAFSISARALTLGNNIFYAAFFVLPVTAFTIAFLAQFGKD